MIAFRAAPQFRFNVREVEMGTRRPLIVQMYHDPTAQEPRCRLQVSQLPPRAPLYQHSLQ